MKKIIYLFMVIITFMLFSFPVKAEDSVLEDILLKEISGDAVAGTFTIENNTINPAITFKSEGDYVIYQLFLKYDSTLYNIKKITDNNKSKNIKTSYSTVDNKVFLMIKYDKAVEGDFELNNINIKVKLQDKNVNPKTGQQIFLLVLFVALIGGCSFLLVKKKKSAVLILLFVPFVVNALEKDSFELELNTENIKIGYTVKFHKGTGVSGSIDDIECIYGETCSLPQNTMQKEGSVFKGWSLEKDGDVKFSDEEDVMNLTSNGKVTLYPVWRRLYTIHFYGNGSTSGSMGDLVCIEGEECILTSNQFSKSNYSFAGWASSSSGDVVYNDQQNITYALEDLDLYAQWTFSYMDFDYSGSVQQFNIPQDGRYKLEVWGAQGGNVSGKTSGKGGYSKGTLTASKNTILYVVVGGRGTYGSTGGYNGGGGSGSSNAAVGGGGTDIRIGSNSLYARVIVAGGGGGAGQDSCATGGAGGGTSGIGGNNQDSCGTQAYGGTQSSGGSGGYYSSTYGQTGSFGNGATGLNGSYDGGGGGGGWYGGGSGASAGWSNGGGGGSGYVYTSSTKSNYPSGCLLNSSHYLTDASTHAGNTSFVSPSGSTETGHTGNGYAKITYLGS